MDDTMEFAPSDQAHRLHPAPFAGYGLQQRYADQWLHSPVLGSTHWDQNAPSPYPSSSPHQSVETHLHQHHQFHQHPPNAMAMEPHSHFHQAPSVTSFGFNGQVHNAPVYYPQPVVPQEQAPQPSSAPPFSLDPQQLIEHYIEWTQETDRRFYEALALLQKHHQLQSDQMLQQQKQMEQMIMAFSYHIQQAQQQEAVHYPQPQAIPIVALPQVTLESNSVDSPAVINQGPQSMDQLILSPSTIVQQQQQQQQTQISIAPTIAVPTPHGGSAQNEIAEIAHSQQSAGVCNSFGDGSLREAIKMIDQHQHRLFCIDNIIRSFDGPAVTNGMDIASHEPVRPKFITYFLDRNGHRMDSSDEHASASSEVFEWMVKQGRGYMYKHRSRSIVMPTLITDNIANVTVRPSSLFLLQKTVAMVNLVNHLKGGDVGNP